MELRYYQKDAVQAIYNHLEYKKTNPCAVLPTGCHEKDHPIMLIDGTIKPVQEIQVGDLLMGPDSKPRQVLNLCRGFGEMFRVMVVDNKRNYISFIVNDEHIFYLQGEIYESIAYCEHLVTAKELYRNSAMYDGKLFYNIDVQTLGRYESDNVFRDYMNKFQPRFMPTPIVLNRHDLSRKDYAGNYSNQIACGMVSITKVPDDNFYGFTLNQDHLYLDGYGIVHHNSGKSMILAQICKDVAIQWTGRVILLSHVKELLTQTHEKIEILAPELFGKIGIHSAGLKSRDTQQQVIVAGIQSVYNRACDIGAVDLILIDELHMLPPNGEGRYQTFIKDMLKINPRLRIVGLTATPFRTSTGWICEPENLVQEICYEIEISKLIEQGYLCNIISKGSKTELDFSGLHVRAGEFVQSEIDELFDTDELVKAAAKEIVEYAQDRKCVLVFGTGVDHAKHLAQEIQLLEPSERVETIFGETPSNERDAILKDFSNGEIKYTLNMGCLTTGYDNPKIDLVAMVRPTQSPGLMCQIIGRGFRIHPDKKDCIFLDFGGNIMRHGPVDDLNIKKKGKGTGETPVKKCPKCDSFVPTATQICACGYEFPPPERNPHTPFAVSMPILSKDVKKPEPEWLDVLETTYSVHEKKGHVDGDPRTLRVDYKISFYKSISEWVCIEHSGWARQKAESWWRQRTSSGCPLNAEEAVDFCSHGELDKIVKKISVIPDGDFHKIIGYEFADVIKESQEITVCYDDEIPF